MDLINNILFTLFQLMQYQNMRGGRIVLQDVQKPAPEGWPNARETMQAAHQLAKATNKSLLENYENLQTNRTITTSAISLKVHSFFLHNDRCCI